MSVKWGPQPASKGLVWPGHRAPHSPEASAPPSRPLWGELVPLIHGAGSGGLHRECGGVWGVAGCAGSGGPCWECGEWRAAWGVGGCAGRCAVGEHETFPRTHSVVCALFCVCVRPV